MYVTVCVCVCVCVVLCVQNENGPCPLLALGNVLLLRQRMKLAPGTVTVTSSHLLHLIATCMLEDIPKV